MALIGLGNSVENHLIRRDKKRLHTIYKVSIEQREFTAETLKKISNENWSKFAKNSGCSQIEASKRSDDKLDTQPLIYNVSSLRKVSH